MGSEEEQQEALLGMQSSAGFFQRALASRVRMRNTPRLRFVLDTSLEEGDRLLAIMDRIRTEGTTENDQTPN
jgi:ribosome-binding factor A